MVPKIKTLCICFLESWCFQCLHHNLCLWAFLLDEWLNKICIKCWQLLKVIFSASFGNLLVYLNTKYAIRIHTYSENMFILNVHITIKFLITDTIFIYLSIFIFNFESRILSAVFINMLACLSSYQILMTLERVHMWCYALVSWVIHIFMLWITLNTCF